MKKIALLLCFLFVFNIGSPDASAGNFDILADSGVLNLGLDKAWSKTYNTAKGKLKIQVRRLRFPKEKGLNHHLIIFWNKDRIADGYMPNAPRGYTLRVFQNKTDERLFVNIETLHRSVLMGYDPDVKKLHKFIDSNNYYSTQPYPRISLNQRNHDLMLRFTGNNTNGGKPFEYRLFWDEKAKWFGYEDVTSYYIPPPPPKPTYTPAPAPSYSNYEPEPEPAAAPNEEVVTGSDEEVVTGSDELFFDDSVVTGS